MTTEISNEALARKQRFLQAKETAGSATALVEKNKAAPHRIYFDDQGEIVCITQDPEYVPKPEWLTYDFDQDQVAIIADPDTDERRYRVKVDPIVDNLYSIEIKPLESVLVDADSEFLYEIESSKSTKWEIKVQIKDRYEFIVKMSKKAKEPYDGIYPVSATKSGQRLLRFYFTAPGDPHIMFHYETISLADLLNESSVVRKLPGDLSACSVFTNKLFDNYAKA